MADAQIKRQKFIKVGNSRAITIDPQFFADSEGNEAFVRYTDDGIMTVFSPKALKKLAKDLEGKPEEKVEKVASQITPELVAWTKDFIQENKQALDELANL